MQHFTKEVEGAPEVPGEGKPRRNAFMRSKELVSLPEGVTSLHDNFLFGMRKAGGDSPYLGTRSIYNGGAGPYVWVSYEEVYKRIKHLGSGIMKRDVSSKNVGLFSVNRAEWVIGEHACLMHSLITVPLYDTLGNEAIQFIITQTNLGVILATNDKAKLLLELKSNGDIPTLKHLIIMDAVDEDTVAFGKRVGVECIAIREVEREGAAAPEEPQLPTPDTIGTICYTSGTTGQPKGVILTHKNMLGFCAAVLELEKCKRFQGLNKDDCYVSYLPLAHVFERICMIIMTNAGGRIGFYQGDTLKLLDDVAELQPTIFASVPRLYNRIYDKVLAGVKAKGAVSQYLFNTAYEAKKQGLASGSLTHFLWDRAVFGTIRSKLGGKVRMLLTGAAPISGDVLDFLRICFSAQVYEGYGQTETCAGLCVTDQHDYTSGHVGAPLPCSEVKLVDVPSMNYTSADTPHPRGEIWCRGTSVFQGYFNQPEETAKALDKDGWCKTGDIGLWDDKGRLRIVDRVKNIFKLAQGEYVAPERVEIILSKHELVAQAFVYGDSLQATLVGVIVPDEDMFKKWLREKGMLEKSLAEHCKDDAIKKQFLKTLEEHGKKQGLKGFEIIKAIHLDVDAFSVENGLLTPTFKLKRHDAKLKYQKAIDAMYSA